MIYLLVINIITQIKQDITKNPKIYTLQAIDPDLLLNINNIPNNQLFNIAREEVYLPIITPNTRADTNISNNKLDHLVTKNTYLIRN